MKLRYFQDNFATIFPMKLMLVEDEYLLNKAIKSYLSSLGYSVDGFTDGVAALECIADAYDLFILDIDIPNISGIELLEEIRRLYINVPIIIISATIDMGMITQAYTKGCNDYLKKPFDIKELALKIEAFTRQVSKMVNIKEELVYDKERHILLFKEEMIVLTKLEQKFLFTLLENRDRVVSHELLESVVWENSEKQPHLRQLVNRLRKKLPFDIIENRVGEGYILS